MTTMELPVVPLDMPRTICDCEGCRTGCRTMPASLLPGDLERIQAYLDEPGDDFVLKNFRVSDGARVMQIRNGQKMIFNVPSIVPAQQENGHCVFLEADGKCRIHPVAPFGCTHFDTHLSDLEANRRSKFCIEQQIRAHRAGGSYRDYGLKLEEAGLQAPSLLVRKEAYQQEFDRVTEQRS